MVAFDLSADAFLYGMVRRIVGFLVEVGIGRRAAAESQSLVAAGATCGARVAPAHGLYQLRPEYAVHCVMRTYTARAADLHPAWYLVDADGQTLGRLASNIAKILKGKHKPAYTPT